MTAGQQDAQQLSLQVRNLGPDQDIKPSIGPCSLSFPADHSQFTDYRQPPSWQQRLAPVRVDSHLTRLAGQDVDQYEVILALDRNVFSSLAADQERVVSALEPIAVAYVGVTAADDKRHQIDVRGELARFGNESPVGGPAKIFRIQRDPPDAPALPIFPSERLYASPADYHSRAFFHFLWQAPPERGVSLHVLRALDDTLAQVDLANRRAGRALVFPPEWPDGRQAQIEEELGVYDGLSEAHAKTHFQTQLSDDALRVLAGLPDNAKAFTQLTSEPLHPRSGTYTDALDGRARNRYFYRAAYVDRAHNRSALSLATPPVYLPDLIPPAKPQILKILGVDRGVRLQWAAHREPGMDRYLIYRADNRDDGRDVRLMGEPVANIPAAPVVTLLDVESDNGSVMIDLRAETDVVRIERVYMAEQFDPHEDWLTGQTADNELLAEPREAMEGSIRGIEAEIGKPVVVVYTDSRGALQRTAVEGARPTWQDGQLAAVTDSFYRIVATRRGDTESGLLSVRSEPSELGRGRALALTPPELPEWERAEWVSVDEEGREQPVASEDNALGSSVAIVLEWTFVATTDSALLQKRSVGSVVWTAPQGWQTHQNDYLDHEVSPDRAFQYRVKVRDRVGNISTSETVAVTVRSSNAEES